MSNLSRIFPLKRNGELVGANIYHEEIISVSIWYYYQCVRNVATDKKLFSRRYKSTFCSFPYIKLSITVNILNSLSMNLLTFQ